jgi:hypothetical protein
MIHVFCCYGLGPPPCGNHFSVDCVSGPNLGFDTQAASYVGVAEQTQGQYHHIILASNSSSCRDVKVDEDEVGDKDCRWFFGFKVRIAYIES